MRLSREERWLAAWLLLTLTTAAVLIALNRTTRCYTGICYVPVELTPLVLAAISAVFTGLWIRGLEPGKAFVLVDGGFYGLVIIASGALATGVQYTPFAPIDPLLARWDAALGYDTVAVLRWVAAHPALRFVLNRVYDSTDLLLVLAPLAAFWRRDERVLRVYLHAILYTFLAGCLFYYRFPSSGPASVFASPDFLAVQRATFMKFRQVHEFRPVTTLLGGMIAFPSFHVAWSVLLTYAALPVRRLFWAAAAWNALVIVTTVVLGWHYAVDVPAGVLLAVLGLAAGEAAHRLLETARAESGIS
jgi:hypothetical protein